MAFKFRNILFLFFQVYSLGIYAQDPITNIKKTYNLDKRTSVFEITYDSVHKVVKGKTNQILAKKTLLNSLKNVKDSIEILPQKFQNNNTHALVNVSVANLRSFPEESAELSSQILLGTPILLLEKYKGWYRVQCPDQYIGWVDAASISLFTLGQIKEYQNKGSYVFLENYGQAYEDTLLESYPIRDLSFGNIFPGKIEGSFLKVMFPDKKSGYLKISTIEKLEVWSKRIKSDPPDIISRSFQMIGIPYLWGGTSFKGVDCSGFIRMVYLSQGIYLPRDASQQALLGEEIPFDQNFKHLKNGDLLFFGNLVSKKISHVGIWIGNNEFIHSSGMVHVSSFDSTDEKYDEYNFKRILTVKRILNQSLKNDPKYCFPYHGYFGLVSEN